MSDLVKVTLRPSRLIIRSGPQGPAGDGGAGAVDSVNGQTGVVVLGAADVGADAAGTAAGLVAGVTAASLGAVPTSRTISTTAPLTGGGDLTANRTFAITVGSTGGVQGWSANLDSYATVAPSAFSLTLLDDADQAAWRSTLGLGSAATQTAQVAPATSRVPLSRSGLARLRPGWAREVGIGTPTAGEDSTLGYEVGDTWTYQGRHYVAESVATGAANWIAGLIASDATATPTASKIPIADGGGKLAPGWFPAQVSTVYTSGSGNYTLPTTGATRLRIELVGGGGGGASGARYATLTSRQGGNGGGGGGGLVVDLPISFFGSPGDSVAYAVGTGGGGGASIGSDSTAGASGTAGGDTTFGSLAARGGAGGTCIGSGTVTAFPPVITRGGNGGGDGGIGGSTAVNGTAGGGGALGGGGGGAGGSIGSGNGASVGQAGGPGGSGAAGGAGGATTPTAGTAGSAAPTGVGLGGGGGGGGGAIATGAAGAAGAAGGGPGGGGGGGAGSINGQASGAGAAGAVGRIVITAY